MDFSKELQNLFFFPYIFLSKETHSYSPIRWEMIGDNPTSANVAVQHNQINIHSCAAATVHVKYGRNPLGNDCSLSKRSRGAHLDWSGSEKKHNKK